MHAHALATSKSTVNHVPARTSSKAPTKMTNACCASRKGWSNPKTSSGAWNGSSGRKKRSIIQSSPCGTRDPYTSTCRTMSRLIAIHVSTGITLCLSRRLRIRMYELALGPGMDQRGSGASTGCSTARKNAVSSCVITHGPMGGKGAGCPGSRSKVLM